MSKLNAISLTLVATLFYNGLTFSNATPKVYQESLTYPDQRVIFSPYYYTSKALVYALCNKTFQAYENNCTMIHRADVFQNETLSCNITLKNEQEDGHLGPTYEVLPLGANKAIFISAEIGEETFVKLSTINLNTCKVNETKFNVDFPYEIALYHVVPEGESYKVIYENKDQCGDKMCVMSIDTNGRKTGSLASMSKSMKPLPFPIVASAFRTDLFFIKSGPRNSQNFILRKPNGVENSISKETFKPKKTILSTSNDLIGVCYDTYAAKTKIMCKQRYVTGQLGFAFTSENTYEQLKLRSMYNTVGGGIILVVDCTDGLLVIKIDGRGNMAGQFNIDDFDCPRAFATATSIFESKDQGHCVSMACREGNDFYIVDQSYLNLVTNCFTDADFTNE